MFCDIRDFVGSAVDPMIGLPELLVGQYYNSRVLPQDIRVQAVRNTFCRIFGNAEADLLNEAPSPSS